MEVVCLFACALRGGLIYAFFVHEAIYLRRERIFMMLDVCVLLHILLYVSSPCVPT